VDIFDRAIGESTVRKLNGTMSHDRKKPISFPARARAMATLVMIAMLFSPAFPQQGGATRYAYDDNGRLRAVIAPNGEANVYEYDAAGNITAIRRNTAATLEILTFSPREGVPGTQVTIVGTGFGGGVNAVSFNGAGAQIVSADAPVIIATVPNGATTGPIAVTTPQGATTTAQPFVVRGVQLAPSMASLNHGQTQQFTATVYPLGGNPAVAWTVDGFEGGNAAIGTITAAGLYTAPMFPFPPVTIRAASVADPSLFEEARVTFFVPPLRPTPVAAAVSVGRPPAGGEVTTIAAVGTGVSIRRDAPSSAVTIAPIGAGVSIRRDAPSSAMAIVPIGAGVSIRRDTPSGAITIASIGAGVSIRRDTPSSATTTIAPLSLGVSATSGPYISAISPNNLARGATAIVTISGANLSGAASMLFIDGAGASDASITASNITVNAGGASLTASVSAGANTALGQRLVVVMTAANRSLTVGTGTNTIQIVP
jgi:YD repeat-containing protein